MMDAAVLEPHLFAEIRPPVLAGSRCGACALVSFPGAGVCPRCHSVDSERHGLGTSGRVWTWTTQAFEPKPPYRPPASGFVPYVVGYVDLGDVLVESRILGVVSIGTPVELVLLDLGHGVTFAFDSGVDS